MLTGSYQAAFANGALWNLFNACIALALLTRGARRSRRPDRGRRAMVTKPEDVGLSSKRLARVNAWAQQLVEEGRWPA